MFHLGYGGEDMHVIVVYDVHQKRCAKVMKYLRQWLEHRQRSVFAGFLTDSQVKIMYDGLLDLINVQYDSVIVFQSNRANQVSEWSTSAAVMMRREGVTAHLQLSPGLSPAEYARNRKRRFHGDKAAGKSKGSGDGEPPRKKPKLRFSKLRK